MTGRRVRLVLFVDPDMANSMAMLDAHLKTAASRDDIEVVAIVDTAPHSPSRVQLPRSLAVLAVHFLCNPMRGAGKTRKPLFSTCAALARRWKVPVIAPRTTGINDQDFVESIRKLEPDVGISLMVAQIFRAPLLEACGVPLNYHPGLLPHYRGIAATGWSIYNGERESGYSFHRMVKEVDQGPVLLQGAVPLGPRSVAAQVERAKSRAARSQMNAWFDILVAQDWAGVEQTGGSSFSRADELAIRTIENPSELTLQELDLRLRAFEWIYVRLAGRYWVPTELRQTRRVRPNRHLVFRTSDGIAVEISRLMHVPPILHKALKPLYGSHHVPRPGPR